MSERDWEKRALDLFPPICGDNRIRIRDSAVALALEAADARAEEIAKRIEVDVLCWHSARDVRHCAGLARATITPKTAESEIERLRAALRGVLAALHLPDAQTIAGYALEAKP